jgi:hypothetical protein
MNLHLRGSFSLFRVKQSAAGIRVHDIVPGGAGGWPTHLLLLLGGGFLGGLLRSFLLGHGTSSVKQVLGGDGADTQSLVDPPLASKRLDPQRGAGSRGDIPSVADHWQESP